MALNYSSYVVLGWNWPQDPSLTQANLDFQLLVLEETCHYLDFQNVKSDRLFIGYDEMMIRKNQMFSF